MASKRKNIANTESSSGEDFNMDKKSKKEVESDSKSDEKPQRPKPKSKKMADSKKKDTNSDSEKSESEIKSAPKSKPDLKKKKATKAAAKSKASVTSSDSEENKKAVKKSAPKKKANQEAQGKNKDGGDEEPDGMISLGNNRSIAVRLFKGMINVDIREYYNSNGELKPGKKGIALTVEQWNILKKRVDDVNKKIEDLA